MGIVSRVIVRALDQDPPFFSAESCLNRRQTKHPCTLCHDRCTGGALPLNPVIEKIDWNKCIGCGVCVSACPSRCFAPDLRQQQTMTAPAGEDAVSFACAHTKEPVGERRVECLCGVPWEWICALALRTRVQLYTGECGACAIKECREQLLENLAQVRTFLGEERFAQQVQLIDDAEAMKRREMKKKVERRALFGRLGKEVKSSVASGVSHALPVLSDHPARNGFAYRLLLADMLKKDCIARAEHGKREGKPVKYAEYGMFLPEFGAKCYGCGVCMRVCPQQALSIEKENEKSSVISIEPWRCTACGLCQAVCVNGGITGMQINPLHHMGRQGHVRVYHDSCAVCGEPIARGEESGLCIACAVKKKRVRR